MTTRGLCESAITGSTYTAISCVPCVRHRRSGSAVGDLTPLSRGDLTPCLLRGYQNADTRRVLCVCSKCAPSHGVLDDPALTYEDAVAMLRRYIRLYCVYHIV